MIRVLFFVIFLSIWDAVIAQTYEGQHITGADLARVLDLQPEDYGVRKFQVDLGAKKIVRKDQCFPVEITAAH